MSSSDPQSNDESVSSGSEKLYYVSAECSELHDGRELLNRIYSINIDVMFNLIFTKSEFMLEFLKSRNFQNVQIGDWLDKTSILKQDQQASSSRNSNDKSSQIIIPKHSSQSSIKKPSNLFLSRTSRATQTSININNESTSDEDTKNDLVIVKSVILNNEDNAKDDIKHDLVIVKSSVISNNENNAIEENNKEEIQKENKEKSIKENNKEKNIKENNKEKSIKENKKQSIKDEQNKKNSSSEDDENCNIKKTKTIQYTASSSIGTNTIINELKLLKCSIPNELYSINELSLSKGILYADTFKIYVHYCLIRVSAEKTKFLVYSNVKFVKNLISFTRNIIESQIWNGLNDYYKELNIQLQDFSSQKPLKVFNRPSNFFRQNRKTFSFSSVRRKLATSRRIIRVSTPDSSYETAEDERGSSSMIGITRSFNALKRKIVNFKTKKTCTNTDTSEDCDEILVNDNINNNDEDDYFRKIWNDCFTATTGLGILIAIGLTLIYFLRR